jgi:hypothetical protein
MGWCFALAAALRTLEMVMGGRVNDGSGPFLGTKILSLGVYNMLTVSTISRRCLLNTNRLGVVHG